MTSLTLEELSPATDGAERVSFDDERRGVWRHDVATTGSCLLSEGLVNAHARCIGRNCFVGKLCVAGRGHPHDNSEAGQREDDRYDATRLFRAHTCLLRFRGFAELRRIHVIES